MPERVELAGAERVGALVDGRITTGVDEELLARELLLVDGRITGDGRELGLVLGRETGRALGRETGRALGRDTGRALGRAEGRELGRGAGRELGAGRAEGRELWASADGAAGTRKQTRASRLRMVRMVVGDGGRVRGGPMDLG